MQNLIHSKKAKKLLPNNQEDLVGGPSIVFTRQAVVDETHIRKSTIDCKLINGIDASQIHPNSMCQPMATRLCTRYEFIADLQRFKPRQNKHRSFKKMVMSYFQGTRPDCINESFYPRRTQIKIDCFNAYELREHCNTVFEAMGCFCHYCFCREA